MLEANNLSIGYNPTEPVFSGIQFSLMHGDIVALLGKNGVGKSTLLRTIAGLQKQLSGSVKCNGDDIYAMSVAERAKFISIVFTARLLIDHITVRDFISLGRAPYTSWLGKTTNRDDEIVERVIQRTGVEKLSGKLFNRISDGEKQKVLIARALCQQTAALLLDEPTAFLDFRNKKEILALLNRVNGEMNNIIIISTHDIEAALEYCNKFWIMGRSNGFTEIKKEGTYAEKVRSVLYG